MVWVCVSATLALSVDGLTTRLAWVAGLAILALVLTGWRKTVRAQHRTGRSLMEPARAPIAVDHLPSEPYRRPGPIRRVLALAASGGLAIVTGAVAATVIAFGVAWAVTTLTSLLKR
jgi:hypothetical protein